MTTKKLSVALAVAAAVSLTACGSGDTYHAIHREAAVEALPVDYEAQGPATAPADLPGDLEARIVTVTAAPNDQTTRPDPGADTLVTVTLALTNDGTGTFLFPDASMYVGTTLLYGENRYEAQGWMTDGDSADLPAQLVPGSSATLTQDFTLPTDGLSDLTLIFNPNSDVYPGYTFSGVQDLLRD